MTFDIARASNKINSLNEANKENYSQATFLNGFNRGLDAEFQKGTVSLTNVSIVAPASTLAIDMFGNTVDNAQRIAIEVARYWSMTIEQSGIPVAGQIILVSNDASKIIDPIKQNILSVTVNTINVPYYFDFINAIIKEVKTIEWTVTELLPLGVTNQYNVTIT